MDWNSIIVPVVWGIMQFLQLDDYIMLYFLFFMHIYKCKNLYETPLCASFLMLLFFIHTVIL